MFCERNDSIGFFFHYLHPFLIIHKSHHVQSYISTSNSTRTFSCLLSSWWRATISRPALSSFLSPYNSLTSSNESTASSLGWIPWRLQASNERGLETVRLGYYQLNLLIRGSFLDFGLKVSKDMVFI